VNDAFEHQTGFAAKEVIGRTIRDLYPGDEAREIFDLYVDVMSSRASVRKEIWFEPTASWYELSVFPTYGDEFTVVVQNITERKVALEELAQEKERLQVTLQSVGDAVVATDAEGRVTFLNPVAEQLTGHPADAATGRPLSDIFHIVNAFNRGPTENPVDCALQEGRIVGLANHTVLLSAGGGEYQIADSAAPIRDPEGQIVGVVLVFRDVSEEYAIQQELRERERDMARAQQLANLGSWRLDLGSGTVTASPQAHRIYGVEEPEISLQRVQTYPLPGYRETLDAALRELIEHGTPYDVEYEIRRPNDGEIRFIHSVAEYDAEQNAVIGTLQDITDRKQTEQALREGQARFATITELSPIGITTVDADGVISYANSTAERILGLQRDEITSRTYDAPEWEHTAPDGGPFPDEDQPFTIVKKTLKPIYGVRHGITWPDGRHVELSINASPILEDDGRFGGMVATIEDITERKRTEEQIHRLLDEKETLLQESHHRVRNNLNTVQSLLSLQSQATDSPQVADALEDAASRIQTMARLYDRLFCDVLTEPMSVRQFLVPLIDEIVEILSPLSPVQVSADMDDVRLDPSSLTTIGIAVNELVTNSVKHAFPGKEVGHISVVTTCTDSRVILTYRDDGPGFSGDAPGGAAGGFGMKLVEMMIENLGGKMRVHPGRKLRIDLEVPGS
jgi:PAS domain S-box-containing protein